MLKYNGSDQYSPLEGIDDCISRPAVGVLEGNKGLSFIFGSHNYYHAKFANRITAKDLNTGRILWSSIKIGDTGFQNHQILDINFDGINEVITFAKDTITKKDRTYLLSGANGRVIKELSWSSVQGVFEEKQLLFVAEKEETLALNKNGEEIYRVPKISFATNNEIGKLILFAISYKNNRLEINTYDSDNGKLIKSYNSAFSLPDHSNTSDYGIFWKPNSALSFLTLADTDNNGDWDCLVQIKDYVVNIKTPFKVGKGINPYTPITYRNIDNSGVVYR